MKNHCASTLLMIRPQNFGFNGETAVSNAFQKYDNSLEKQLISSVAMQEFDDSVAQLRNNDIDILIFEDTEYPCKPDAIFPNNWISMHEDGTVILYPMMAQNRRVERRTDIIEMLESSYTINKIHDLSANEIDGRFLEGTGSIVFDHKQKIAYAAKSERTDIVVFYQCCSLLGYSPVTFRAYHSNGLAVYHTNVLMHLSPYLACICIDMIHQDDRQLIIDSLSRSGHEPILLSEDQVNQFAGNMLVVHNSIGTPFLIGSKKGFSSLTEKQMKQIPIKVIMLNIPVIESIGGGSARCMLAEVFLPTHIT